MESTAGAAIVCDDPERAAALVAAGHDVVLIVGPDGESLDRRVPKVVAGGGRLAVLAGRAGDPGLWEVAQTMAAELFGPRSEPGRSA
jgi:hypothetical protein